MSDLPPIKKNALNESKLRLYAKRPEGQKGAPNLCFSIIQNQPRIDVFTNNAQSQIIRAKMDSPTFYAFISLLEEMIDSEPGITRKIKNKKGPPNNLVEESTTWVGKNNKGVIFICVESESSDRIMFPIKPSMYHSFIDEEGSQFDEARASVLATKGWVKLLTQLVANVLDSHFVEKQPYQGGKGGGNNYNRNNNTGGGGSDRSGDRSGDMDDFPM